MPPMNEQGARIVASGRLDRKAVAGNYLTSTRALMMAYRKLRSMVEGKDVHVGTDAILLDKVMSELSRRGKQVALRGIK